MIRTNGAMNEAHCNEVAGDGTNIPTTAKPRPRIAENNSHRIP